jgi:hypothetical protein
MKKSKVVFWIAAAAVALALYLLISTSTPTFTATYSKDVDRFGPDSVDMQMAMGNLHSDPPHIMAPPQPQKPLLLFPPSEEDLKKLSGPPANV